MIAVDWGTSTLRAFQLDAEGAWVARTAAARGLAIIGRAAGWR